MLNDEFIFTNLYDHYKDTIKYLKSDLSKRDSFTLYSLIFLIIYFFVEFKTTDSISLANTWLDKKIGLSININYDLLSTGVLLLLFIYILRYFQMNLNIEKQYNYIHKLENDLNTIANRQLITREGFSYLQDYPLLPALIHRLYNFFLPIGLILFMSFKIVKTCFHITSFLCILNIFIGVLIILCAFLYLLFTFREVPWVNSINSIVKKLFVHLHLYKED